MGKPENARRLLLQIFNSISPGEDRYEQFLTMLHGPGWKERAIAAGLPARNPGRQLSELNERVRRIERHLNLEAAGR